MTKNRDKPKKENESKEVIEPKETKSPDEIQITNKPNIIPAKGEKPDQSIINQPAPKKGLSLVASWGHNKHRK